MYHEFVVRNLPGLKRNVHNNNLDEAVYNGFIIFCRFFIIGHPDYIIDEMAVISFGKVISGTGVARAISFTLARDGEIGQTPHVFFKRSLSKEYADEEKASFPIYFYYLLYLLFYY
jgi:hypothetical protein